MKFDIDRCIKLGLLKRIPPSKEKAEGSMKNAENWLREAKNNLQNLTFRSCILTSYLAMFHAARAILFIDGFREKSHFAVARYLEDKYATTGLLEKEWIDMLDFYRETRHEDQYSISFFATKEESEKAFQSAKGFVKRMRKLFREIYTSA